MNSDLDLAVLSNRTALLTLFSTCEEMILLAEKGQWDRVTQLESRRSRELVDFFSAPMMDVEAAVARKAILKLSEFNDRLVELAANARDETAAKLKTLHQSSTASRTYQESDKPR